MRHAIAGRVPTYECIGVLYLLQVELAGRRHEGGSTRNGGLPPTGAGLGGWLVAEAYQFLDVGVRQAIVTATAGG